MRKKRTPDQDRRRRRGALCPKSPTGKHLFICGKPRLRTVPAECKHCHRRRRFRLPKRLPIYAVMGTREVTT